MRLQYPTRDGRVTRDQKDALFAHSRLRSVRAAVETSPPLRRAAGIADGSLACEVATKSSGPRIARARPQA